MPGLLTLELTTVSILWPLTESTVILTIYLRLIQLLLASQENLMCQFQI